MDLLSQYPVEQYGRESDLAANIRGWYCGRARYDDVLDRVFASSQRSERFLCLGNLLSEGGTLYGGAGAGILSCLSSSDLAGVGIPDANCIWDAVHGDSYGAALYTVTGEFLLNLRITLEKLVKSRSNLVQPLGFFFFTDLTFVKPSWSVSTPPKGSMFLSFMNFSIPPQRVLPLIRW